MEAGVLLREDLKEKHKRFGIILLGKGMFPKDYPKEKIFEYELLKLSYKFNKSIDFSKFNQIRNEIKNWPRNEENDPYYFNLIKLAEGLRFTGNFIVEIAFEDYCNPDVFQAISNLSKFPLIFVIPIDLIEGINEETYKNINEAKKKFNVEIVYAWPFDFNLKIDFLTSHIFKFIKNISI